MEREKIDSFQNYLECIEKIQNSGYEINLFRGQSTNAPLLPIIARANRFIDTTKVEKKMIDDLKRRSPLLLNRYPQSDWEWLILAQHFGLKTRLLDWSSNPLIALWFACSNMFKMDSNSYVYTLCANSDMLVDLKENESPFENSRTKILRPTLNNERIIAQAGWFTAHRFSRSNSAFVQLEKHRKHGKHIRELEIPAALKKGFLKKLSIFGVDSRTVFPDITGLCLHLNWEYEDEILNTLPNNNL